jgi:hypothetical protein
VACWLKGDLDKALPDLDAALRLGGQKDAKSDVKSKGKSWVGWAEIDTTLGWRPPVKNLSV